MTNIKYNTDVMVHKYIRVLLFYVIQKKMHIKKCMQKIKNEKNIINNNLCFILMPFEVRYHSPPR